MAIITQIIWLPILMPPPTTADGALSKRVVDENETSRAAQTKILLEAEKNRYHEQDASMAVMQAVVPRRSTLARHENVIRKWKRTYANDDLQW